MMRAVIRDAIWRPMQRWQRLAHARTLERRDSARFQCPVCGYHGIFIEAAGPMDARKYGRCPECGAFERHRLQAKALDIILADFAPETKSVLHFSPEPGLAKILRARFTRYKTADLLDRSADVLADLRDLPIADNSFDFVFASHVLEHIREDRRAIGEIYRIVKPGGIAVLPVPIVGDKTLEYPRPVASENGHIRAPGPDYFDRYREFFDSVQVLTSADFDGENQLYIYEDRTDVPNEVMPYRRPMLGERHLDYVPVCLKRPCHFIRMDAQDAGEASRSIH
jgi:SAM-dependent methyltransferase